MQWVLMLGYMCCSMLNGGDFIVGPAATQQSPDCFGPNKALQFSNGAWLCVTLSGVITRAGPAGYVMELHQTEGSYIDLDGCLAAGVAWKATFPPEEHWHLHHVCVRSGGPGQPIPR